MNKSFLDPDITRLVNTDPYPETGKISFIGPLSGADKIRGEFSNFSWQKYMEYIVDLGNYSALGHSNIVKVLQEISSVGGPVVSVFSHKRNEEIISELLQLGLVNAILSNKPMTSLAKHCWLGIQSHYFPLDFNFDPSIHLRLGDLRSDIDQGELLLRKVEHVCIDLSVLRYSDNIGHQSSLSSGLHIEELCKLARYAGSSKNLQSIVITGYDENNDSHGIMARNCALVLYYIIEGFKMGSDESKRKTTHNRYTVMPDDISSELVFFENPINGRWWVEMYSSDAGSEVRLACTEKDYADACKNVISDRLTTLLANI